MTLWTPSQIATSLWLDASDNTTFPNGSSNGAQVTIWKDKSGNSLDAFQTGGTGCPTITTNSLNSLSGVSFVSSNSQYLNFPQPFHGTTPRSIFVVASLTTLNTVNLIFSLGYATTIIYGTIFDFSVESSQIAIRVYGNSLYSITNNTNSHDIFECLWASGNISTATVFKNGNIISRTGGVDTSVNTSSQTYGSLGYSPTQGLHYLNGKIYEVILLNSTANTQIRQYIEGYLAWKWGLEANLSIDHPYYSAAPTIVSSNLNSSGGIILGGLSSISPFFNPSLVSKGGIILGGSSNILAHDITFIPERVAITPQEAIYKAAQKNSKYLYTVTEEKYLYSTSDSTYKAEVVDGH
jgi:hypothetical protein